MSTPASSLPDCGRGCAVGVLLGLLVDACIVLSVVALLWGLG